MHTALDKWVEEHYLTAHFDGPECKNKVKSARLRSYRRFEKGGSSFIPVVEFKGTAVSIHISAIPSLFRGEIILVADEAKDANTYLASSVIESSQFKG